MSARQPCRRRKGRGEMARLSYAYYPGCTAKTTAKEFEISTLRVCEKVGIELIEIEDWNCCGASSAHTISPLLGLALPARDLQTAERMGKPVATGCAMCWHRLKYAVHDLADKKRLAQVNQVLVIPIQDKPRPHSLVPVNVG